MSETSFLDNLKSVVALVLSKPLFCEIFILTFFFLAIMIVLILINNRQSKITLFIVYLISLLLLVASKCSSIFSFFDKFIDFIFESIYFPSFIMYLILICLINFNLIYLVFKMYRKTDILSDKLRKIVNIFTITIYCLIQFLFFIVLEVIIVNDIDIFNKVSLYSNESIVGLIQVSTILFIFKYFITLSIWIIVKINNIQLPHKTKKNILGIDDINVEIIDI